MAAGVTSVGDLVVPENFTRYIQQFTETKSRLVRSGALMINPLLSAFLAGGGLTINVPSFTDLDNDDDNVSTSAAGASSPNKIGSATEIAVRLSRNNSWSDYDLAAALSGENPIGTIRSLVGGYWVRRLQTAFVATMGGVFKDNDANDAGDYTHDISGVYTPGVTDFSAEAIVDALLTAGDSLENLSMIMVHSIVYGRMIKNDLIDFVKDSTGTTRIATFMDKEVIVDDGLPSPSANTFETWLFGAGAVHWGQGVPRVPTEVFRNPEEGNGGGQETLFSRLEWSIHPVGHAYDGTPANGGPGNGTGANDLNNAASWNRVYTERKQIKIARLITTES